MKKEFTFDDVFEAIRSDEESEKDARELEVNLIPKEIKNMLDDYVIEQDDAKKVLSILKKFKKQETSLSHLRYYI